MRTHCECISYGCKAQGGVDLDMRVFRKHSAQDMVVGAKKAQEDTDKAIQDQLEAISIYLAATTLSDDLPEPCSAPGGRLWSRSAATRIQESNGDDNTQSPSRQEVIHNLLKRLSEIESSVECLSTKVTAELEASDAQSLDECPSFPLRHLEATCLNIQMDLNKITMKTPAVSMMKGSIEEKLARIMEKVKLSKTNWIERRKVLRAKQDAEPGIKHCTGTCRLYS